MTFLEFEVAKVDCIVTICDLTSKKKLYLCGVYSSLQEELQQ